MSVMIQESFAALAGAYTGTPVSLVGLVTTQNPGLAIYELQVTSAAWWAQGIGDTPVISNSASADTLSAPAHGLLPGMPIQISALVDQAISKAWQVSAAAVFVDETTAINNATANDVQAFATGVLNDYLAVGYTSTFGQLKIVIGTSGTVGTAAWEYWNGTAWTALSGLVDNSTQLKAAPGTVTVTYTTPSDWAPRTLNGSASLYFIRVRALTTYTVNPLITQAFIEGVLPTGLAASTTYWAIVVDANTFKLATTRANALAGTAIDITTNGGGNTVTTVAVAGAAGSVLINPNTVVNLDGVFGTKVSVVQDSAGGKASITAASPRG